MLLAGFRNWLTSELGGQTNMKKRIKFDWISVLLIGGSLLAWGRFPHTFDSQYPGHEYLPFIAAGTYILLSLLLVFDRRGSLTTRLNVYMSIVRISIVVILFQYYVSMGFAFGIIPKNIAEILSYPHVPIGILMVLIGNHIPQLPPNSYVGIRTPWTLKDSVIWRKTHRIGGYLSIAIGFIVILLPLWLPGGIVIFVLLALLPIYGILIIVFSYGLHRFKVKRAEKY